MAAGFRCTHLRFKRLCGQDRVLDSRNWQHGNQQYRAVLTIDILESPWSSLVILLGPSLVSDLSVNK